MLETFVKLFFIMSLVLVYSVGGYYLIIAQYEEATAFFAFIAATILFVGTMESIAKERM